MTVIKKWAKVTVLNFMAIFEGNIHINDKHHTVLRLDKKWLATVQSGLTDSAKTVS